MLATGFASYFIADYLDNKYQDATTKDLRQILDTGLGIQNDKNKAQDTLIEKLISDQIATTTKLQQLSSANTVNTVNTTNISNTFIENLNPALDGTTLSDSVAGLRISDSFIASLLATSTSFSGDITGLYNQLSVINNSHNHTGATISGLAVTNFGSANISQWTNNSGYLTNSSGFVQNGNSFGTLAVLGTLDGNGLAFQTNSAEAMRILSNGNVGIGNTSPANKLDVTDALTSNGLVASFTRNNKTLGLYSDTATFSIGTETNQGLGFYTNDSANQMVLDTSGRLGVGTNNPGARLEVDSGISGIAGLKFSQIGSSTPTLFSNGKLLTIDASGNIVLAVDQVGLDPSALPSGTTGQTLYNNGVGWAATSNLYNTGGRIGIGTTNPQDMLHIYGTDNNPLINGLSHQNNSIIIDGVADGDKNLIFADAGVNKWSLQTFRNESGEFLYFHNYTSVTQPIVISETGLVGINNPSNEMYYHAEFLPTTSSEGLLVGGYFTGEFQTFYQLQIDGNGTPDTFRWRTSRDNLNFGPWTSGVSITGLEQTINNGVTATFENTTGHTIGDQWNFTAFGQLPRATLSVGPEFFDEVQKFDGVSFIDETSNANSSVDASLDLVAGPGQYEYFGLHTKFNSFFLNISTPAVGSNLVVEYWNGSAWAPVTTGANSLLDDTADLTQSGQITFDKSTMTDWAKNVTVSDYVDLYYWIRISSSTTPSTVPQFKVVSPSIANRLGIYAGAFDTSPVFSVDAIGNTVVGSGLKVIGVINSDGVINAANGVSVGVGQSYTGAGPVNLTSAAASALNVTSGTTGALTLDSGTTGAVNLGTGANAKVITCLLYTSPSPRDS